MITTINVQEYRSLMASVLENLQKEYKAEGGTVYGKCYIVKSTLQSKEFSMLTKVNKESDSKDVALYEVNDTYNRKFTISVQLTGRTNPDVYTMTVNYLLCDGKMLYRYDDSKENEMIFSKM